MPVRVFVGQGVRGRVWGWGWGFGRGLGRTRDLRQEKASQVRGFSASSSVFQSSNMPGLASFDLEADLDDASDLPQFKIGATVPPAVPAVQVRGRVGLPEASMLRSCIYPRALSRSPLSGRNPCQATHSLLPATLADARADFPLPLDVIADADADIEDWVPHGLSPCLHLHLLHVQSWSGWVVDPQQPGMAPV